MGEMIDRIAKAMFMDRYGPECNGDQKTETFWPDRLDEITIETVDSYRSYAHAAIAAMQEPTDPIKTANSHKKRSLNLVLGVRQDLQGLAISSDIEKQILASVLNRINQYLDGEGVSRLSITGIPQT